MSFFTNGITWIGIPFFLSFLLVMSNLWPGPFIHFYNFRFSIRWFLNGYIKLIIDENVRVFVISAQFLFDFFFNQSSFENNARKKSHLSTQLTQRICKLICVWLVLYSVKKCVYFIAWLIPIIGYWHYPYFTNIFFPFIHKIHCWNSFILNCLKMYKY
jgi:hypothetical protein